MRRCGTRYYGAIRVPYRFATTDAEDNSVDSTHEDYYHGIELMGSQNCAAANNRCLPINYIKYEGKPFAAEKISALPVRAPLEMEVIRANGTPRPGVGGVEGQGKCPVIRVAKFPPG